MRIACAVHRPRRLRARHHIPRRMRLHLPRRLRARHHIPRRMRLRRPTRCRRAVVYRATRATSSRHQHAHGCACWDRHLPNGDLVRIAPGRPFAVDGLGLGAAHALRITPVFLIEGRTACVQFFDEMLTALLLELVALDARLNVACVWLTRVGRVDGHGGSSGARRRGSILHTGRHRIRRWRDTGHARRRIRRREARAARRTPSPPLHRLPCRKSLGTWAQRQTLRL